MRCAGHEKELSGGAADTTNNRMELTALLEGLRALKEPCEVSVTTDSEYVANGITKGWAVAWKRNNWVKSDKKPALNPELWDAILNELARHRVTMRWVRGHAGHPENERCDRLAVAQARKYKVRGAGEGEGSA